MSTEPLFRDDAYLGSCVAKVVAVHDRGIELDRTVFYPAGGGQPGDIGELRRADGLVVPIVDTPAHPATSYACIDESGGDVRACMDREIDVFLSGKKA